MDIIHRTDQKQLDRECASLMCKRSRELLKRKKHILWALPGGRSVHGIYDCLSRTGSLDWARIHFFMTDERLVAIDDSDSNYRLAREKLLDPLLSAGKIKKANVHPFIYMPGTPDSGLGIYRQELIRMGGCFDLILLSSGEDGHIASLFPAHHTISDDSRYFITTFKSPKPPPGRMSASRKLVAASGSAFLLFYGREKKDAFQRFMDPEQAIEACPARLALKTGRLFVFADQASKEEQG